MRHRTASVLLALCLGLGPAEAMADELPIWPWSDTPPPGEPQRFEVIEGEVHNRFYRWGPVAAHALATSGERPRLIVAFPAGNEGVALWFSADAGPVGLELEDALSPAVDEKGAERAWGVFGTLRIDQPSLTLDRAVAGSIRSIRDVMHGVELAAEQSPEVFHEGACIWIMRPLLDGRMSIVQLRPLDGAGCRLDGSGGFRCDAAPDAEQLRLMYTVLGQAEPLSPIPPERILREGVEADPRDLESLAFLTYEEKLLAGSWRFLTYFGRDTLLSVAMLMPAVRSEVTEAGLRSVLTRLDPDGDVAHEEDIGDWAALRHAEDAGGPVGLSPEQLGAPIHDYKMVDDDFLLAPVAAAYLLDDAAGPERGPAFLGEDCGGRTCGAALLRNLLRVVELAGPFGDDPVFDNLIALREGEETGEWRDSTVGLGGGRVPYNVNGVLVPAALRAAARLLDAPGLWGDTATANRARELAVVWDGAADLFTVTVPERAARRRIEARCAAAGLDSASALASVDGPLRFPALSLDARGRPLPVMHSDDGFDLLFGEPPEERLLGIAGRIERPFPAGLRTDVGILVANASLAADGDLRALFTPDHYHGEVVWSWQQALLAAGLRRQLARTDLGEEVRHELERAQATLWTVIEATDDRRRAELWSWRVEEGRIVDVPFGQGGTHRSESNAVQLWSTVYIGVRPP